MSEGKESEAEEEKGKEEGGGESKDKDRSEEEKESQGGEEKSPSPAPPPTPSYFTVLSGNLKDILSWEEIEGATYKVYEASSLTGSFTLTTETKENSYVREVSQSEVGYRYYKVVAVREGLESTPTEAQLNEKVFIEERVSPDKETALFSSNGELSFSLPSGAVSKEVTITIEEKGLPHDTPNYTDTFLTSSYDFQPEGLSFLSKPLLSLKYIPPVSEEQFEKDWLSKTAKLFYFDESVGVWLDVSDSLSVDTTQNLLTSKVSHFSSYAGGYTVMPHGRYSDATNLCNVCHEAHDSQGNNLVRRENVDLCYYCHGAPTSTLPPSGAHGENVQAEFVDIVDTTYTSTTQSRHPVPEREIVCADCHTPHRDPDDYPKLLFEWDPSMGSERRTARKYYKDEPLNGGESSNPRYVGNSTIGNNFCWGCHGSWENTFINNPTYYSESGGDHKTGYENSAHWTGLPTSTWVPTPTYDSTCNITDTTSTAINCLNCHLEHGSNAGTRLTGYRGSPKKEEELCYSCHSIQQSEFQSTYRHAISGEWGGVQKAAKVECTSCHNPHLVRDPDVTPDYMITDPDNTKNIWEINAANNYRTGFCLTCHDGSPPKATISTSTLVPYTILFPDVSQYPLFPGWDKSEYLNSVHWTASSLPLARKECTNCHSQHGTNYYRMLKAPEDDGTNPGTCLYDPNGNSCHVSGSSYGAPDIKTSLQRTYAHPVLTYSGRHSDTETASSLGSNRHAECVDCHNPHVAQSGTHTPGTSTVSKALKGTWGVKPPDTPAWQVPDENSYTIVKPAQYEYQICFKCHSSFAFGSNPPSGLTDQAKEFNPNNASYHGVMAIPTDTYSGASYDSPWTYNSRMYCSDCHGSDQSGDAEGPHGSNRDHILKGRWDNTMTYKNGYTGSLCDRCHNIGSSTGFNDGKDNLHTRRHDGRACINCHSRIPHGMNNNHLWVFGDDPAPYKDSNFRGRPTAWPHKSPGNWREKDCHDVSFRCD